MSNNTKCTINGTVAPGFESVRELFELKMNTLAEEHSQLCVYHRGEKVVDLWASVEAGSEFSADTLINVFSSGKSFEVVDREVICNEVVGEAINEVVGEGVFSVRLPII